VHEKTGQHLFIGCADEGSASAYLLKLNHCNHQEIRFPIKFFGFVGAGVGM